MGYPVGIVPPEGEKSFSKLDLPLLKKELKELKTKVDKLTNSAGSRTEAENRQLLREIATSEKNIKALQGHLKQKQAPTLGNAAKKIGGLFRKNAPKTDISKEIQATLQALSDLKTMTIAHLPKGK